jgi:hypothetical protein
MLEKFISFISPKVTPPMLFAQVPPPSIEERLDSLQKRLDDLEELQAIRTRIDTYGPMDRCSPYD